MTDRIPRKRNLLADKCAVFEANNNKDSQSGSFLTNLVRARTPVKSAHAMKDDSTQVTVDISENSFTTIGSGSISASIRNGTSIEMMDAIGEHSISDIMNEHFKRPIEFARKRNSLISRMNVSDVSFDTVSPQVSSSNLFQNSFEAIHQPVMEVLAKDGTFVSPSKRRSNLIANRAAMFEGCSSPPSGFIFSQQQSKSPRRVVKNDSLSPTTPKQIQIDMASLKLSNQETDLPKAKDAASVVEKLEGTEKRSQSRRRVTEKDDSSAMMSKVATASNENAIASEILRSTPRRRTSCKRVISTSPVADPVAVVKEASVEKISKPRRHKSLERRRTVETSEKCPETSSLPRKTIIRRKSLSHIKAAPKSPVVTTMGAVGVDPVREDEKGTVAPQKHSIHGCNPIVRTSTSTNHQHRVKTPERRKAMLKKLLKIKRKPCL